MPATACTRLPSAPSAPFARLALEAAGVPVLQPTEALGCVRRVLHPGMVLQHNSRAAYVLHMNAYVSRMRSYAARDIQ